jgi:hypothetical protein
LHPRRFRAQAGAAEDQDEFLPATRRATELVKFLHDGSLTVPDDIGPLHIAAPRGVEPIARPS